MKRHRVCVTPVAPFDFDLTAGHHASNQTYYGPDLLRDGVYTRLLDVAGRWLLVSAASIGSVDAPELEVTVSGADVGEGAARAAADWVAWTLGAEEDLGRFYSMASGDPVLGGLVRELYGLHPARTTTVFEALVTAITAQQIATNVARIIRSLLVERYGQSVSLDGRTYHTFPSPEALLSAGMDGLRAAKLSGRKAEYILAIASEALDGSLEPAALDSLSEEEMETRFTSLRGVGKWTWRWLQIRTLELPDGFPSGDLALRRIVSRLYLSGRVISENEVEEFSQRWSPFRSLTTLYLFAAARCGLLPD